jgi:uncharacterized repeat protein (TIGR03803 family)
MVFCSGFRSDKQAESLLKFYRAKEGTTFSLKDKNHFTMKKIYNFILAASCFVLCFKISSAQPTLWGAIDSYNSFQDPLFYVTLDGSDFTYPLPPANEGDYGDLGNSLFRGKDGNVYGLNYNNEGHIFYKITKDGIFKIYQFGYAAGDEMIEADDGFFYNFSSGIDGNYVVMSRIRADGSGYSYDYFYRPSFFPDKLLLSDGAIYGVNPAAGQNQGSGYLFKFKPGPDLKGFEVIYNFSPSLGRKPAGRLLEGTDGYLYGVTTYGGVRDYGTIFKISKDGKQYIKLHDFDLTNGRYPKTGLVLDSNGWLYGTTTQGGENKKGVIFKMRMDGSAYTVVHHFSGMRPGPLGELVLHNGLLYGYENGVINSHIPTIIYRFDTRTNVYDPIRSLPLNLFVSDKVNLLILVENPFVPNAYVTTPSNNATGIRRNTKFIFNRINEAKLYTLELSKTPDFSSEVIHKYASLPEYYVEGLEYNTRYYTRVKTNVWPTYGPVTTFTTEDVPTSFVSNPPNGAINVDAPTVKVTANVVSGATLYTVELSTSPDFTNPILKASTKDHQRTFVFDNLAYATTYYARARTDISGYGRVTHFTTKAAQPMMASVRSESSVAIYPNPSASSFTINLQTPVEADGDLIITDMQGQVLLKGQVKPNTPIIIGESLKSGMYLMKITQGKETTLHRILKK